MSEHGLALVTGAAGGIGLSVVGSAAARVFVAKVAVSGNYSSAVDTPMLRLAARHGEGLLNFVGTVSPVSNVVGTFEKAPRTKKLELYHPYGDGVLSRFLQCFPGRFPRLLGLLEWMGQHGLTKFLATTAAAPS